MDRKLGQRFPIYKILLRLYPQSYREQYGGEILQTLADMLDDAPTRAQRRRIWIHAGIDIAISATKQQATTLGGTMRESSFIKWSSITSAALLLPFISALIANALDTFVRHQTLYSSWLWREPMLAIWVLYLPLIAGSVGVISFIAAVWRLRASQKNVLTAWPLAASCLVALGILGMVFMHDSVRCVTGNPIKEIRNAHATLHCIEQR
jgi:hypothetical protein